MAGVGPRRRQPPVSIRVHRIRGAQTTVLAEESYGSKRTSPNTRRDGRAGLALQMLDALRLHRERTVVVAGPTYGCSQAFRRGLEERRFDFIVELRPSDLVDHATTQRSRIRRVSDLNRGAIWAPLDVLVPVANKRIPHQVAMLGQCKLPSGLHGQLFAASVGGIRGKHRSVIYGLTNCHRASIGQLVRAIGWARWIRLEVRRQERSAGAGNDKPTSSNGDHGETSRAVAVVARANITLGRQHDSEAPWHSNGHVVPLPPSRRFFRTTSRLNVVELFAGAGGMGLGFLRATDGRRRFRIIISAEVNPICVETLRRNHRDFESHESTHAGLVPALHEPIDLRDSSSLNLLHQTSKENGGVHLVIGGPPCQGFSNANRNSWRSDNPHNRLVGAFMRHVEVLRPPAFLMENVQGILWTRRKGTAPGRLTVVDHLARRLARMGYIVFPKLLDAVWFGVPQHRSRFFLLGLHSDLGYKVDDFGSWGPFPTPTHGPGTDQPYVTVRDALADLPGIGNGADRCSIPYSNGAHHTNAFVREMRSYAARDVIVDHVTSKHAPYVIERYRRIPEGGNWQDIEHMLTNYTGVTRTHSNIYRRLRWDEPAITIGHYRKSMLVHPRQHRGLSLREATRLQSFPDWFCFAGTPDGNSGGLVHKQQQLANAVCPLVSKIIGEFILRL